MGRSRGPGQNLRGQTLMKQRTQDFALGLTAIAVLALFMATILFIYPMFHARGREVVIHFDHDQGMAPLKEGSAVVLGGSLQIGRVLGVQLETADDPVVPGRQRMVFVVRTEIDQNVPLHGNCQITTDQPAIGGSGFISVLNLGTPEVPLSQPLKGLPPQSLASAIGQLSRRLLAPGGLVDNLDRAVQPDAEGSVMYKVLAILDDLAATTGQIKIQMSPGERDTLIAKLHAMLDDLALTTTTLRQQMAAGEDAALLAKVHVAIDRLSQGLTEATALLQEGRPLVRETLTSLAHAMRTVDEELLPDLQDEFDPANPQSLFGKVHVAMDQVNASLASVQVMTQTSERLIKTNRPAIEQTLKNLESMSAHLEHAALKILLNPRALLVGTSPQREDQLVVFQAARSFAEAAGQLNDAAGRLQAVLETLPADGQPGGVDANELRAVQGAIQAAFQRFERAEEVLWQELK